MIYYLFESQFFAADLLTDHMDATLQTGYNQRPCSCLSDLLPLHSTDEGQRLSGNILLSH